MSNSTKRRCGKIPEGKQRTARAHTATGTCQIPLKNTTGPVGTYGTTFDLCAGGGDSYV